METTDGLSEEVILNSFPFHFQRFNFLDKCLNSDKRQINCFDVNENYFIFGTNFGSIYCFRRHVFDLRQLTKCQLISSPINVIKLITDELLSFVSDSGVYVINRLNHKFLYGWKCPTKAIITCLQTFMSINDQKLLLITGDSDGLVRFHDLIDCKQTVVYKEFGFQIIQIEFIDNKTLLISSSLKTVIIEIDFSDPNHQKITQIGKNERKTFGKFGSVYSHKDNIIYGSRPSLHLIKAETNGNVIETIRINNIVSTDCPQPMEDSIQKPISGQMHYKLGILKMFCCDRYILSLNDENLLIIGTDGQFCIKEKIPNLIDVKISSTNTNEAFLLLQSKDILRICDKQMTNRSNIELSSESDKSCESEDCKKNNDFKSSSESLITIMKGPALNVNPISFIDEELKKVFDFTKLQMKLTEKYNQLSSSIISTIDPNVLPNSDKNVFVTQEYDHKFEINDSISPTKEFPDFMSPLVVTRKGKRKTHHKSSESILTTNSGTESEDIMSKSESTLSLANSLVTNNEITVKYDEINCENTVTIDSNEDNRLQMILSAYKIANNILDPICDDSETLDSDMFGSSEISDPISDNQSEEQEIVLTQSQKSNEIIDSKDRKPNEELETKSEKSETDLKAIEHKWRQIFSLSELQTNKKFEFSTICSTGYNSDREIGLIWFVSEGQTCLVYYPSFDSLDLKKVRVIDITCAPNRLYVLTDSGLIFQREGMDATKPVGTKWTQIKAHKTKAKITSISLSAKNSIIWCCDSNGETWVIRHQKWSMINDFSSHSIEMKKVCISSTDPTIVWGIDKRGKIFVRSFNTTTGDKHEFSGDEWLLMEGLLASDIVICDNYVLISVQNNQLFRRSAKLRPNDSLFEWQPMNGPEVTIDDCYSSISVTENNEIWIMTAKGVVWHTFRQMDRNSTQEDLDWLLI